MKMCVVKAVVVGLVEVVEVMDSDYLVVEVEVEVRLLLRLLLLFLPIAVQENWFDLAMAGDPQVVVQVLQFVIQDDPFTVYSFFHYSHLSPYAM